jgi:hypothetical protein
MLTQVHYTSTQIHKTNTSASQLPFKKEQEQLVWLLDDATQLRSWCFATLFQVLCSFCSLACAPCAATHAFLEAATALRALASAPPVQPLAPLKLKARQHSGFQAHSPLSFLRHSYCRDAARIQLATARSLSSSVFGLGHSLVQTNSELAEAPRNSLSHTKLFTQRITQK